MRRACKDFHLRSYFAALVLVLLTTTQLAIGLDFQSSRTLSLAQGGRAGAMLNDTITLNPSLLGFQPVAAVSGTFNWLNGSQYAADDSKRTYNASVIDGKNQYVNAGISFTRRPDIDFIHLALAKRIMPALALGASVKRFATRSNTGKALMNPTTGNATGFETGASLTFVVPNELSILPLQIGLTADNLFNRPQYEKYVGPRQMAAGAKVTLEKILMVYGDFIENFSTSMGSYMQWAAGAEVTIGGGFFGRGGLLGGKYQSGFGFGAGWVGPKLGVSYGFQNRLVQSDRNYQHAITMDIFM